MIFVARIYGWCFPLESGPVTSILTFFPPPLFFFFFFTSAWVLIKVFENFAQVETPFLMEKAVETMFLLHNLVLLALTEA
jgi:hypothetical protein